MNNDKFENKFEKRTWAEINLNFINKNFTIINRILNNKSKLMAIVKADAYGHGAVFAARELELCGVDFFGVSSLDEALQLRENNIKSEILILGYTSANENNVARLIKHNLSQTIFDFKQAQIMSDLARGFGGYIKAHVKIDTGMNRLGLNFTSRNKDYKSLDIIKNIKDLSNINLEGIFTHFACADDLKSNFTREQFDLFLEFINNLDTNYNIKFKYKHAANSAATLNFAESHLDYVRCGLILYGLYPAEYMRFSSLKNIGNVGLEPVMQLKTTVSHIHTVKRGESVSYARTYKAGRDIQVATLPIGYADGFSRLLSNSASVLINGKQAPVIGRVCMDQCMIDVTDCNVKTGDTAVIFGKDEVSDEYLGVEQIADMTESINYEVVCLIGKRVPRIYFKDGKEIGRLNYIVPE